MQYVLLIILSLRQFPCTVVYKFVILFNCKKLFWDCETLLGAGEGANIIFEQVSPLVDSEVDAYPFVFFNVL